MNLIEKFESQFEKLKKDAISNTPYYGPNDQFYELEELACDVKMEKIVLDNTTLPEFRQLANLEKKLDYLLKNIKK